MHRPARGSSQREAWRSSEWGVLVILCCVTNYPKLVGFNQQPSLYIMILCVRNLGRGPAEVHREVSPKSTWQHSAGGGDHQEGTWCFTYTSGGLVNWRKGSAQLGLSTAVPPWACPSWWPQGSLSSWQLRLFMTQSQNHVGSLPPHSIGPSLSRLKRWGHRFHLWKEIMSKNLQLCLKLPWM